MGILSLDFEGMGLSQQLFWSFFSTWAAINYGQISGMEPGCCESKTVGSYSYTLVEDETASEIFGCKSLCVYKMDGMPDSRYCFKSGDLPVSCTGDSRKIIIVNSFSTGGELSGTVNVRVYLSVNFNVSRIESIPWTIGQNNGQTTVTLPSYGFGNLIVNITSGICIPVVQPITVSVFSVGPAGVVFPPCSVEQWIGEGSFDGTCTAVPDASGQTCNLDKDNCVPGFNPSYPVPNLCCEPCPCLCKRDE